MSKKCRAYSESKLGLEPTDNRKAFYAGWEAALVQQEEGGGNLPPPLQAEPVQEPGFWGRVAARQASRIKQLEITAQQARQAEPVREPVAWRLWDEDPQGGGDWRYYDAKDFKEGIDPMKYFDGLVPLYTTPPKAEPVQEPDLSRCPQCNGPADNGHDRSLPPNPYLCTKCMAEMPQPSYNVTVVDDAHPNGIPLEQWQNKPVQEPVAWMSDSDVGFEKSEFGATPTVPLYTAPPQRKPLTKEEIMRAFYAAEKTPMSIRHGLSVVEAARIVEKAHGIGEQS